MICAAGRIFGRACYQPATVYHLEGGPAALCAGHYRRLAAMGNAARSPLLRPSPDPVAAYISTLGDGVGLGGRGAALAVSGDQVNPARGPASSLSSSLTAAPVSSWRCLVCSTVSTFEASAAEVREHVNPYCGHGVANVRMVVVEGAEKR